MRISTSALLALAATTTTTTNAFAPGLAFRPRRQASTAPALSVATYMPENDVQQRPFFVDVSDSDGEPASSLETPTQEFIPQPPITPPPPSILAQSQQETPMKASPPKAGGKHQEGVFSPLVLALKDALGDEKLNKIRAKAISLHSDVIGGFVDTSDSSFGAAVLKTLFSLADKNGDGVVEEAELAEALQFLGFDWLKEKQIKGILKRADKDSNGLIDLEEWSNEAPKTLRTNLTKLAKKNGGAMGLLV